MNLKGFIESSPLVGGKKYDSAELNKPDENREFVLFRRVQGAMRYAPDFVETCKSVLNAVMDGIDAENCSIMLKDPVSGELTVRAARGKERRENGLLRGFFAQREKVQARRGDCGLGP